MMLRVAWRSLMTRPVRAAVLAAGFGFGIAVMVALLGVGQVILEQAHAPALQGGGDLVISGPFGQVANARFVLSTVQHTPEIADRISAISATRRTRLYLITPKKAFPVTATGGVPSLERSIGDPEVAGVAAWTDAAADRQWARPEPGDVLRAMDRFHPIPASRMSPSSWAEWLYFNGRTRDGRVRLYVTFLAGPPAGVPGAYVITTAGLALPETVVTLEQLQQLAAVPIDVRRLPARLRPARRSRHCRSIRRRRASRRRSARACRR